MKITYLYNSGFLIELANHYLLFDFYKGSLPKLNTSKPLYIFVTHIHSDHYNPNIYQIAHPNKHYIISEEIENRGLKVAANQTYQLDDLTISTLLSTDEGVALIINVENKLIYHAGDLNWWDWIGEPQEFLANQEKYFKDAIARLPKQEFDLMFAPLDPRLEKTMAKGFIYLLDHTKAKYYIPMHFTSNEAMMVNYIKNNLITKYPNIIILTENNNSITIKDSL